MVREKQPVGKGFWVKSGDQVELSQACSNKARIRGFAVRVELPVLVNAASCLTDATRAVHPPVRLTVLYKHFCYWSSSAKLAREPLRCLRHACGIKHGTIRSVDVRIISCLMFSLLIANFGEKRTEFPQK